MTTRQQAERVYRRINSFSNPSQMNGIDREWIIEKIEEGLAGAQRERRKIRLSDISIETKIAFLFTIALHALLLYLRLIGSL